MVSGGLSPNALASSSGLIVCSRLHSASRQSHSNSETAVSPLRPLTRHHARSTAQHTPCRSHGCPPASNLLAGRRAFYGAATAHLLQSKQHRWQHSALSERLPPGVGGVAQPTTAAAAIFGGVARSLLRASPRHLFRSLSRLLIRAARPLLTGPGSVFVVLFTLVAGVVAAIRARMWTACRNCKACHGFGIERCSLCRGAGVVGWEGKWSHKELCPSCLGKRFVSCPHCGGHFHRPTFVHARCRGRADALASMDDDGGSDAYLARMVTD